MVFFSQTLFSTAIGKLLIGTDDDTFISGLTFNQYFKGDMDEVRIWDRAIDQESIRINMCKKLNGDEQGLVGYWNFDDNSNPIILNDIGPFANHGSVNGGSLYTYSGAPIGDISLFNYTSNWDGLELELNTTNNDFFKVSNVSNFPEGIHIYKVNELPNVQDGIENIGNSNSYYGTFATQLGTSFSIQYAIGNAYPECEVTCETKLQLYSRNDNAVLNWDNINSTIDVSNCQFQEENQSTIGLSRRAEYIPGIQFSTFNLDLGDDITICGNQIVELGINFPFPANYLWQDGSTEPILSVTESGTYWLQVETDNCTLNDTIQVNFQTIDLGNDTVFCDPNPSLFLDAFHPLAINYQWHDSSLESTFQVSEAGVYWVDVNFPSCTFRDSFEVQTLETDEFSLGPDTFLCENNTITIGTLFSMASYEWQDGSIDPFFTVDEEGLYWVKISLNENCILEDSVFISYSALPAVDLGNDTTFCNEEPLTLNVSQANASYQWQDGSIDSSITINSSGTYWVEVTTNSCTNIDTINLNFLNGTTLDIGNDTTLCHGDTINLGQVITNASYSWNLGDTEPFITINEPGIYTLDVLVDGICSLSDSVEIMYSEIPVIDLGNDTTICLQTPLELSFTIPNTNFLWDDGSNLPFKRIDKDGVYRLTVNNGLCFSSDSINVTTQDCKSCNIYTPNAFSPNLDGVNDLFKSYTDCELNMYNMKIFDRWGELVFETNSIEHGWDGIFRNQKSAIAVYVYLIEYSFAEGIEKSKQTLSGSLLLVR